MPIVFEQPSPMGYSPAAGAQGTVDQTNKNIQFLLDAARNRGGGGGTGAAGLAAQEATTQAWSRANQNQTDLEYQGQLQQQAMAQQSAQQQAAMQQNADQFTFADQLQLQKYQAGLSQLNQSLANGELTQQEFQEGLSQYTGVISPLQTKAQAAKQKMLQQQYETMTQQGALESAQVKTAMQMLSGSQNGVLPVYDDDKNQIGFVTYDPKTGKPTITQLKPQKDNADAFQQKQWEFLSKEYDNAVKYFESLKDDAGVTKPYTDEDVEDRVAQKHRSMQRLMGKTGSPFDIASNLAQKLGLPPPGARQNAPPQQPGPQQTPPSSGQQTPPSQTAPSTGLAPQSQRDKGAYAYAMANKPSGYFHYGDQTYYWDRDKRKLAVVNEPGSWDRFTSGLSRLGGMIGNPAQGLNEVPANLQTSGD